MKKEKIRNMGIFLVAILMLLSTATAISNNREQQPIKIDIPNNPIKNVLPPQSNVQISSNPLDEKHPAITKAPDGSIIVAFDRK